MSTRSSGSIAARTIDASGASMSAMTVAAIAGSISARTSPAVSGSRYSATSADNPAGSSVMTAAPSAAAVAVSDSAHAQILPPGTTPTKLTTGYVFTEGPLYDRAGGVYFEDMHPSGQAATNPSHIVRYDIAAGIASVVDANSGGANGDY